MVEKLLIIFKSLFQSIFSAIIFVLIPIIFITLISSRTTFAFGLQSFTVLSGSMEPLIPTGSVVYTVPSTEFQVGEIITFKKGDMNVTHRIVDTVDKNGKHISTFISPIDGLKQSEIFYKTKGDANNIADADFVRKNQIIGKTMTHIPSIGRFASFIKSIPGFIALIVLPTLIFVGIELWKIKSEIEKEVEKKTLRKVGLI